MTSEQTDSIIGIVDVSKGSIEYVPENDDVKVKETKNTGNQEIPIHENTKKRKNFAIEDDFFALTSFTMKKKEKKNKKIRNKDIELKRDKDALVELLDDTTLIDSSGTNDVSDSASVLSKSKSKRIEVPKSPQYINKELGEILSSNLSDDSDDDIVVVDDNNKKTLSGDNQNSEKGRKYNIIVINKIPVEKKLPKKHKFQIMGVEYFRHVIGMAIDFFYKRGDFPGIETSLIWIEGKMELKPFFKPSTLGIPREKRNRITELNCLLIPKKNVSNFLNIYDEFRPKFQHEIDYDLGISDLLANEAANTNDDNDVIIIDDNYTKAQTNKNNTETYFNIGLKGKDNKRITVEVCPSTKIRALLDYFLKVKNITSDATNAKLIFDDEELIIDGVVGDTELEEDFEVQIVI